MSPESSEDWLISPASSIELLKFLDHAEACLRLGNIKDVVTTIFVWSQRSDRILAGEETFEDQHLGSPWPESASV